MYGQDNVQQEPGLSGRGGAGANECPPLPYGDSEEELERCFRKLACTSLHGTRLRGLFGNSWGGSRRGGGGQVRTHKGILDILHGLSYV